MGRSSHSTKSRIQMIQMKGFSATVSGGTVEAWTRGEREGKEIFRSTRGWGRKGRHIHALGGKLRTLHSYDEP